MLQISSTGKYNVTAGKWDGMVGKTFHVCFVSWFSHASLNLNKKVCRFVRPPLHPFIHPSIWPAVRQETWYWMCSFYPLSPFLTSTGELVSGRADMALTYYYIQPHLVDVVEFSRAFMSAGVSIITRKNKGVEDGINMSMAKVNISCFWIFFHIMFSGPRWSFIHRWIQTTD